MNLPHQPSEELVHYGSLPDIVRHIKEERDLLRAQLESIRTELQIERARTETLKTENALHEERIGKLSDECAELHADLSAIAAALADKPEAPTTG